MTIFIAQNLRNFRANIFFANFCAWSAIRFAYFFLRNLKFFWVICAQRKFLRKTCYCKLTKIDSFRTLKILNGNFKSLLLLVECIRLKYQLFMSIEIKIPLKLSQQIFIQPRIWSVATSWLLILHRANSILFCRPRPIHLNNTRLFLF